MKHALLSLLIWISGAYAASAASTWEWQLSAPFDLSHEVEIYDVDPDNHSGEEIAALNARGVKTICYVSVGTLENGRDDGDEFPAEVIGKVYGDWPDERFLDIRQLDVLLPLMKARFQRCKDMGFAAVEPDNQDVHDNESGFPVTSDDTIAYVKALADIAHEIDLEIGQKNIPELTGALVNSLDFIVTEGCFVDGWCEQTLAYTEAGKPILAAEYSDTDVDFNAACAWGKEHAVSFILKDRDLTKSRTTCS